jgi:SNF2 family DNA or RNA helicase
LFDQQKYGVRWLYERNGAILGDDPGTGKTLSTLTAAGKESKRRW